MKKDTLKDCWSIKDIGPSKSHVRQYVFWSGHQTRRVHKVIIDTSTARQPVLTFDFEKEVGKVFEQFLKDVTETNFYIILV